MHFGRRRVVPRARDEAHGAHAIRTPTPAATSGRTSRRKSPRPTRKRPRDVAGMERRGATHPRLKDRPGRRRSEENEQMAGPAQLAWLADEVTGSAAAGVAWQIVAQASPVMDMMSPDLEKAADALTGTGRSPPTGHGSWRAQEAWTDWTGTAPPNAESFGDGGRRCPSTRRGAILLAGRYRLNWNLRLARIRRGAPTAAQSARAERQPRRRHRRHSHDAWAGVIAADETHWGAERSWARAREIPHRWLIRWAPWSLTSVGVPAGRVRAVVRVVPERAHRPRAPRGQPGDAASRANGPTRLRDDHRRRRRVHRGFRAHAHRALPRVLAPVRRAPSSSPSAPTSNGAASCSPSARVPSSPRGCSRARRIRGLRIGARGAAARGSDRRNEADRDDANHDDGRHVDLRRLPRRVLRRGVRRGSDVAAGRVRGRERARRGGETVAVSGQRRHSRPLAARPRRDDHSPTTRRRGRTTEPSEIEMGSVG